MTRSPIHPAHCRCRLCQPAAPSRMAALTAIALRFASPAIVALVAGSAAVWLLAS